MFGTPQDIIAILAGAALIFGGGGAAIRSQFGKPGEPAAKHDHEAGPPAPDRDTTPTSP